MVHSGIGRSGRRRPILRGLVAGLLLLLGLLSWVAGCATTIEPPPAPTDPVTVFLLDHGHTSSLVLPAEGGWVRYAYGDWNYYALGNDGFLNALAALFWPTRGTLGRKEYAGPAGEAGALAGIAIGVEKAYPIVVERAAADRLRRRLDGRYRQNLATEVENPGSDLRFVHDPDDYCILHDSNRVAADWLSELGCRVRGIAILSRWDPRPAGD